MAIKHFQDNGVVSLAADGVDTDVMGTVTGERKLISAATATNTTGGSLTVVFYDSSDTSSANGEEIDRVTLGANETRHLNLVGQVISNGRRLVAVAGTGAVADDINVKLAFSSADGGS